MSNREILIKAIKLKKMVDFSYEYKPIRRAAPHAIYISSKGNENLDAFQYGGFSKNGDLPIWRNFKLLKIMDLKMLDEKFETADGYRSNSSKYNNYIYKI